MLHSSGLSNGWSCTGPCVAATGCPCIGKFCCKWLSLYWAVLLQLADPVLDSSVATGCPCIGQFCCSWLSLYRTVLLQLAVPVLDSSAPADRITLHYITLTHIWNMKPCIIILTVSSLYFSPSTFSPTPNFRNALLAFSFAVPVTAPRPATGMSNLWHFIHSTPNTASNRTVSLLQLNKAVVLTVFRQYYYRLPTNSFPLSALLLIFKGPNFALKWFAPLPVVWSSRV